MNTGGKSLSAEQVSTSCFDRDRVRTGVQGKLPADNKTDPLCAEEVETTVLIPEGGRRSTTGETTSALHTSTTDDMKCVESLTVAEASMRITNVVDREGQKRTTQMSCLLCLAMIMKLHNCSPRHLMRR